MGIQDLLTDETAARFKDLPEDKRRKVERRVAARCSMLAAGALVATVTFVALLVKLFAFIVGA
ncbi:MAG: hypothetical protein LBL86_12175 [Coriobacteriales bacterium]|jgi:hypothetical protein|nr:hypothetical protein [Coriobacteriales bacterium]